MSKLSLIGKIIGVTTCTSIALMIVSIDAEIKTNKYNDLTRAINKITINFRLDRDQSEIKKDVEELKKLMEKRDRVYRRSKLNTFVTYNGDHYKDNERIKELIKEAENYLYQTAEEVEAEVIED